MYRKVVIPFALGLNIIGLSVTSGEDVDTRVVIATRGCQSKRAKKVVLDHHDKCQISIIQEGYLICKMQSLEGSVVVLRPLIIPTQYNVVSSAMSFDNIYSLIPFSHLPSRGFRDDVVQPLHAQSAFKGGLAGPIVDCGGGPLVKFF